MRARMLSQRSCWISTTFFLKTRDGASAKCRFVVTTSRHVFNTIQLLPEVDCTLLLQTWQAHSKTDRTRAQHMVIRWSGGTLARFKTLSKYHGLHALFTISLVFWHKESKTWITIKYSRIKPLKKHFLCWCNYVVLASRQEAFLGWKWILR